MRPPRPITIVAGQRVAAREDADRGRGQLGDRQVVRARAAARAELGDRAVDQQRRRRRHRRRRSRKDEDAFGGRHVARRRPGPGSRSRCCAARSPHRARPRRAARSSPTGARCPGCRGCAPADPPVQKVASKSDCIAFGGSSASWSLTRAASTVSVHDSPSTKSSRGVEREGRRPTAGGGGVRAAHQARQAEPIGGQRRPAR